MASSVQHPANVGVTDFFVSYAIKDGHGWARWISHQLEEAGYRTMLQSRDFVPGSSYMAEIDRGLRESAAVIAVLTPEYLTSEYARMEALAALRAEPSHPYRKLIPVRVADCDPDGLLASVTYLDMVGVADAASARQQLLNRVRDALDGRAAQAAAPPFPPTAVPAPPPLRHEAVPSFPPTETAAARRRDRVSLLHLTGPRFGRGLVPADGPSEPAEWKAHVVSWLGAAQQAGAPEPDALLVSGNLTENGGRGQMDKALGFLREVAAELGFVSTVGSEEVLDSARVAIVPGPHDVNLAACRAYFAGCEADDLTPQPPYSPKWRHYERLLRKAYRGVDSLLFDSPLFDAGQPWTLFELTEARVVVAAFNSTMALSHRREDDHGQIGEVQAAYFARALRRYQQDGWLRVGLVAHGVPTAAHGARHGAGLVSDAHRFEQVLGGLNLVVHGSTLGGSELGELPGQLPVLPPGASGSPQLLELTPEGMTRWSSPDGRAPARPAAHRLGWVSVGATFPSAEPPGVNGLAGAAAEAADSVDPLKAEPADPRDALLDRVAQVCEVRMDRARLRALRTPEPHLRVTYADGGFARTLLLGAVSRPAPVEQFERLVAHVHAAEPDDPMEVVHDLAEGAELTRLRGAAEGSGVRLRSLADFQGLPDLGAFLTDQSARLAGDRAYAADQYVSQRFRSVTSVVASGDEPVQPDVVAELERLATADDGRFVLLLGDFGFGKTFALRELTRRLAETPGAPLPILIDLRLLDRAHSVEGLIAAHLANHGEGFHPRSFRYLLRQGRIALIFDGFDELVSRISYDRAADHLERLVQAMQENAKIVVASRTQHFLSREQVYTALGERVGLLPQRRILQLESFDRQQIVDYLARAYGDQVRARARFDLFQQVDDLGGLAANPRLLTFLARLSTERLDTLVQGRQVLSAAELYQEIIEYWLDVEARRAARLPGAAPGLTERVLLDAVTRLALRLWERGEVYLRPGDIREVAATLTDVAAAMTGEETEHALGSGSLLTRTDEGLFAFIHSSVSEWLVASHIARRLEDGDDRLLRFQRLTDLTMDFLCSLAPAVLLDDWAREAGTSSPARSGQLDPAVDNALAIGKRLDIEVSSDLSGADLSGQDLSRRRFHGVNLSGANLSGTLLAEADLSGANLSRADLTGAVLRDADLSDADLTGARLDRAQLIRAVLDGARVSGGSWDLAAVVGVDRPDLAALPELRGAAVAPPMPVSLGLAPAEVGVPYGYEIGRIPDPVSFHPRGTTLVYAGSDGGLLVCDGATGHPVRTVDGHRARVYGLRHSADGRLLLSGSADGTARIWDADTLAHLHTLDGHRGWVWPIELSPDGRTAATGDASGDLRLWNTATGECTVVLHTGSTRIYTAAFQPGLHAIATGEDDGTIRVWNMTSGQILFEARSECGTAFRVTFSPDGRHLATAHQDGTVFEYDVTGLADETGVGAPLRLEGTGRPVYCLTYHPDGQRLATGDTGGTVTLWRLHEAVAARSARGWAGTPWTKHTGAVYALAFSRDGALLASGDSDGRIRLGEPVADGVRHLLQGHQGSVWPMEFRPDGARMATSSSDGSHRLWDTGTGANVATLRGHGRRLSLARYDQRGARIVTSGTDGVARVWDAHTGRLLHTLQLAGRQLVSAFYSLQAPSGTVIGSWDNSGDLHLWDALDGAYVRQILTDSDHLWTGKFSVNGEMLATAEDDDSVRLRYWTTGRLIGTFAEHRGRARSIAFSPDERWLATGADDREVRIWDLTDRRCVLVLRGHTDRVYSVAWDPASSTVVSASSDGSALVWDVAAELARVRDPAASPDEREREGADAGDGPVVLTRPRYALRRGRGRLWSVAVNPAGTVLATAGDDLAVRLWDLRTGLHLETLLGHTRRVWSVDFSPTENTLVSSGDDGTALIWDLDGAHPDNDRAPSASLIGMASGWIAATPDGRYKGQGDVGSEVWHVIGNSRFPLDSLSDSLPRTVRRITDLDEPLVPRPRPSGHEMLEG